MKNFLYEFRTRRIRRSMARDSTGPITREVSGPEAVVRAAQQIIRGEAREVFLVFYLDARNMLIGYETVAIGTLAGVDVHPREVFRTAILASAASIIVVHNHPSGDPRPGPEDMELTARLRQAGDLIGIPLLDHIVVTEDSNYSFAKEDSL